MKNEVPTPRNERFSEILKALEGVSVTVAGDIMLDRFVYGHVERISPESPVPVLVISREDAMLGGAGNTLANLAGLKAKAKILSVTGEDGEGRLVAEKAKSLGLDCAGLLTDKTRPTIVKTRFLAGHQQLLRTDSESRIPVPQKIAADLLKKAETLLKDSRALILSDYGKGLLQPEFVFALITLAKKNKIPVIVDPKGRDFSLYKGADVITPNRKELAEATSMPVATDEEVIAAAENIIGTCGVDCVVATRSRDGISVIRKSKKPVHFHGRDIEVFDVSGAGDTVIAVLAAALAAGAEIEEAAQLANIAGGIAVTKVGTAPIRTDELQEAFQNENDGFAYANKKAPLASWEQAAEEIRRWKARGLKTGFTNGCFDILHAGHVQYLNAARGECDRLIVGLNRDISVRLLKGEDRPVHEENARAAVLAALACVDMVVLFGAETKCGDNTASELLKLLQPDLYFKGGDYKPEQIPEAPAIRSYGGEIRITSNFEGHSTTKSITKIRTEAA